MKKILLVAAFVLGISAVSLAQGPPSPEERLAGLKTSLSLNDAQTAKVKVIVDAQSKSMDSLFNAGNGDFPAIMPKLAKLMETNNGKIKATLTPEQAAIFQKQVDAQAEMMKRFQQGGN